MKITSVAIGVDARHSEYVTHFSEWTTCRIAMEGEESVKLAGKRFLPSLIGQNSTEYNNYKYRAMFYEASARTKLGLLGMLFRKRPLYRFSALNTKKNENQNKIIDGFIPGYESMSAYMRKICNEILTTGRVGILVDADEEGNSYLSSYNAEDIINWRYTMYKGEKIFTLVVLREVHEIETGYNTKYKERFRVLTLDMDTMAYHQGLYEQVKQTSNANPDLTDTNAKFTNDPVSLGYNTYGTGIQNNQNLSEMRAIGDGQSENSFTLISKVTPEKEGIPLTRIPFYPINSNGSSFELSRPPLLGLVNVNLSHYRSSADLEHGRHFTGLPTPCIAGFEAKSTGNYTIGSPVAWSSSNKDAKAYYLEFTGQGLSSLERALEKKEELMTVLGARLLETARPMPEAADTQKVRRAGETSVLANIADIISEVLTNACILCAEWNKYRNIELEIIVQKDYSSLDANPQLLMALLQAVSAGVMSYDSLFHNLRKMDLVPDGTNPETELMRIEDDPMSISMELDMQSKISKRAEISEHPGSPTPKTPRIPLEKTLKNEKIGDGSK